MREAVLDTRVDQSGRALVLFRGSPLQGCSGLEMSAAVTAIAAWAAANNGIVRMRTTLPDGSISEDLIHGDGTVLPAARAGSGRRTAAPVPVPAAQTSPPVLPAIQSTPPVQPPQHVPEPARNSVQPVPPTFPANPFTRMGRAESDPPRPPHRFAQALGIMEEPPAPRTQASWRMPLEDEGEVIDVEGLAGDRLPPANPVRKILLRAGVIILLAAVAALLGVMFLLPAPAAQAAHTGPAVTAAPSGIGDELPENRLLTFSLAGGLAVAAGGTAGLLLTKALRKPKPSSADDLDDEFLLNVLDAGPLSGDGDTAAVPAAGENPGARGASTAE